MEYSRAIWRVKDMKEVLIPDRLVTARKAMSITKLEAARRMNIRQATYVRYENGDRNPTYATIIIMAQVLRVSPEYLIGKEDKPQPQSIVIDKNDNPEMYKVMELSEKMSSRGLELLLKYAEELSKEKI